VCCLVVSDNASYIVHVTARTQKLATLNEWTPNVETDQYDVVCDVDATIS
jgi:hypothetical protein